MIHKDRVFLSPMSGTIFKITEQFGLYFDVIILYPYYINNRGVISLEYFSQCKELDKDIAELLYA